MKLLNEQRIVAHQKIVNRIANQLARMIRKTTLINLLTWQIIWWYWFAYDDANPLNSCPVGLSLPCVCEVFVCEVYV